MASACLRNRRRMTLRIRPGAWNKKIAPDSRITCRMRSILVVVDDMDMILTQEARIYDDCIYIKYVCCVTYLIINDGLETLRC